MDKTKKDNHQFFTILLKSKVRGKFPQEKKATGLKPGLQLY